MRVSMREQYLERFFMEKGMEKGRFQTLLNAAKRGMSDDQLIAFHEASPEEIARIHETMDKAKSV